jgi:hypothetical protein
LHSVHPASVESLDVRSVQLLWSSNVSAFPLLGRQWSCNIEIVSWSSPAETMKLHRQFVIRHQYDRWWMSRSDSVIPGKTQWS